MVLGGTGHLGAAIARRLAEAGYQVTASGRQQKARPNLADTDIQIVAGDDAEHGVANSWIDGMDLVVDAATPYPLWLFNQGFDPITHARRRIRGILEATKTSGAGLIHISSFTTLPAPRGVLGQIGQGMLQGAHSYFELKRQVEAEVLQAIDDGLRGCVLNPATCLGPYDLKPRDQAFIPMLLTGEVKGLARQDLNIVDVRDLAEVALAAILQDFPYRQVPVFGHNRSLTQLSKEICEIGGGTVPWLKVPSPMGVAGLMWVEAAMATLGRQAPWPALPMMLLAASYPAAPSAAQQALSPVKISLDQTLRDAIHWYRQIGHLP